MQFASTTMLKRLVAWQQRASKGTDVYPGVPKLLATMMSTSSSSSFTTTTITTMPPPSPLQQRPTVACLVIGDEILTGKTHDSNSHHLGISIYLHTHTHTNTPA
jgi:molybdopterin-biosynthesis enzyme MoeA-like protein